MQELFEKSRSYDGKSMEILFEAELEESKKEIIWITHDEFVFYVNDDGGKGWSDK